MVCRSLIYVLIFCALFVQSQDTFATSNIIHLALDDGPTACCTYQLLRSLDGTPATFFLIGRRVDLHPVLAQSILESGSTIGNHTYSHVFLPALGATQQTEEIIRAQEAIIRATGYRPVYFRPPYGGISTDTWRIVHDLGLRMVWQAVIVGDYAPSPRAEEIVRRVLHLAHSGAWIALHDGNPETVKALPAILAGLRAEGYTFVKQ